MHKPFKSFLLVLFLALFAGVYGQSNQNLLYFTKPAASLQAAFPISNGTILALTSGTLAADRIPVYDGNLWLTAGATSDQMPLNMPFRKMADLLITHTGHTTATGYSRDFNLNTGVSTVKYTIKGVTYTRTYVSSKSDSVLLIHLKASKSASINIKFNMTSKIPQKVMSRVDDRVVLTGFLPAVGQKGFSQVIYRLEAKPYIKKGRVLYTKDVINITKADEVTIIVSTSCQKISERDNGEERLDPATRFLNRAYGKEFSVLQQNHVSEFLKEFQAMQWTFQTTASKLKTTDLLLQEFAQGKSPEFLLQLASYGRYLRRYCSNNQELYPNFYLESGLDLEPNVLSSNGLTPIWPSELFLPSAPNNAKADAWMFFYFWKLYRYTDRLEFLQSKYPFIKTQTSKWISPTWSGSSSPDAYKLDKAMVNTLFYIALSAGNVVNGGLKSVLNRTEKLFADSIKRAQSALSFAEKASDDVSTSALGLDELCMVYPMGIATPYNGFAQVAHLYTDLSKKPAANVPNEWMAGAWLRLFNANKAVDCIRSKSLTPNLLDASGAQKTRFAMSLHPLILDMLLQSHDDFVFVLPALPAFWKNGTATGLPAEGGFSFNLSWKNGAIEAIQVSSRNNRTFKIRTRTPIFGKILKPIKEEILSAEAANMLPVSYLYEVKMNAGEKMEFKTSK